MNLLSCLIAAFRCVTDRISISNHRRPTIQRIRQRCRRTGLAHICITMSLPHCRCCRRGHFPLYSPFDWNGKVEIDLIETWTRSGLLGKAWLSQRPTREQKKHVPKPEPATQLGAENDCDEGIFIDVVGWKWSGRVNFLFPRPLGRLSFVLVRVGGRRSVLLTPPLPSFSSAAHRFSSAGPRGSGSPREPPTGRRTH